MVIHLVHLISWRPTHQHHRHQDLHRHHKNDPTMIFYCALHNLQCATLQLISWRLDHAFNQTAVRQSAALIWTPPLIIIVIALITIMVVIAVFAVITITNRVVRIDMITGMITIATISEYRQQHAYHHDDAYD